MTFKNVMVEEKIPGAFWTTLSMENATFDNATTSNPPNDPFKESDALFFFRRIVPGILLLIGLPGNVLSIAVMLRQFFRSTSAGLYLLILLIADTCYLFSNYSFIFWLINNFGSQVFDLVHNGTSCKLWVYISQTSGYISSWTLVALTVERAVVISKPHRTSIISSRKRTAIVLLAIIWSMIGINLYIPITFDSVRNSNTNPIRPLYSCFFKKPNIWMVIIHYILPFLMYCFLPACCLIGANVVVFSHIRRRPKIINTAARNRENEMYKVTVLLVAASTFFLLSTFPLTTFLFIQNVLKARGINYYILTEMYNYVMVLMPLNQSFNFVIYCISGASFRKELMGMFSQCCKHVSLPKCRRRKKGFKLDGINAGFWARINHASVDRGTNSGSTSGDTENTYL